MTIRRFSSRTHQQDKTFLLGARGSWNPHTIVLECLMSEIK